MPLIIAEYLLLLLAVVEHHEALPYNLMRTTRESTKPTDSDDCLIDPGRLEECRDKLAKDHQLSQQIIVCLNSCASCVKQWRAGVYNGRVCALDCIQQGDNLSENLDPDCNLMKYFNSTILSSAI